MPRLRPRTALVLVLLAALLAGGCSLRRFAVNRVASALSSGGDVWESDGDPELVGEALPFALKTTESLLAEVPDHRGLLLTACEGFTSYSYGWVELEAGEVEPEDWREAERLRERALGLYLRARDYCLRGLELDHPGISERLATAPREASAEVAADEIELLYWTGASWGSAISLGLDRPELVVDLEAVRALLERALELEPDWGDGSLHEAMITVEALPEAMGGSPEAARRHFERAVELAGGERASPYVTLAAAVSVPQQEREEFERLLGRALAIDPDEHPEHRLENLLAQRRARQLLDRADELFL